MDISGSFDSFSMSTPKIKNLVILTSNLGNYLSYKHFSTHMSYKLTCKKTPKTTTKRIEQSKNQTFFLICLLYITSNVIFIMENAIWEDFIYVYLNICMTQIGCCISPLGILTWFYRSY